MSNRRHIIYDPSFSDYAFRTIKAMPAAEKSALPIAQYNRVKNDAHLRDFVDNEPLEYILIVLAKLGKQWDLRVYDEEESANYLEFNTVNQFQFPQKRVDVIEATVREKVHYLSSNDVVMSAMMGAQNVHTNIYFLSANSLNVSKRARSLQSVKASYRDLVGDAEDGWECMAKMLRCQLNSFPLEQYKLFIRVQMDMRILCALFEKKHSAMNGKDITEATALKNNPAYIKQGIGRLLREKYIMSDAKHGPKPVKEKKVGAYAFYMITAIGIKKVMEHLNLIHDKTFEK